MDLHSVHGRGGGGAYVGWGPLRSPWSIYQSLYGNNNGSAQAFILAVVIFGWD